MSYYAALDGDIADQLGSNSGWAGFGRWVDGLDARAYPDLVHLREHGWAEGLEALAGQLQAALRDSAPAADVRDTAENLLRALAGRGGADVLTVTDGTAPAGEGEGDTP